jgi:hypothetical protein
LELDVQLAENARPLEDRRGCVAEGEPGRELDEPADADRGQPGPQERPPKLRSRPEVGVAQPA